MKLKYKKLYLSTNNQNYYRIVKKIELIMGFLVYFLFLI